MPERQSAIQGLQFGKEVTAGTPVAANKVLSSFTSFDIGPKPQKKLADRRPQGQKFPVGSVVGKEWTEWSGGGDLGYVQLPYLLAGVLGTITPTGPGAQTEYTWAGVLDRLLSATPQTYTIQHGDAVRADQVDYALMTDLGIVVAVGTDSDVGEATFTCSGRAREFTDGATLTASPTHVAELPTSPQDWKVYLDTSGGGIGGTQLTRAFRFELGIGGRWRQLWSLNADADPVGHSELAPSLSMALTVEADAAGMALLTAARSRTTRYLRVEGTGPLIGGAVNNKITMDFACEVVVPDNFSNEQDVTAMKFALNPVFDSGLSKAFTITDITTLTAL